MTQLRRILEVLAAHEVDFVVVGGLAAVLQGVPVVTQDVDIVYSRDLDNQRRLLSALQELQALFRADPRRLGPKLSHLTSAEHKLLTTPYGDVDCLGTIEDATSYEELLDHVDWLEVAGIPLQVLSLPRLIQVKQQLKRPKDQLMLLQLRATLEEREKAERGREE